MKISVLASGSTGNATYIETPKSKVLVDAGLSGKKIEELMNSIGRTLKDVDSLLVTWGVSLFLQQLARSIFGSPNVGVLAPSLLE